MIKSLDKSRHNGIFSIAPDRKVHGTLSLDGPNTSLYVSDKCSVDIDTVMEGTITGTLDDRTKVSLIACRFSGSTTYGAKPGEISYCATIFPHYVIFGDRHLSSTNREISSVSFVLDDATIFLHEYGVFGFASDAHSIVQQIVASKNMDREILGEYPVVAYYTGKKEIFSSNTALGTISAFHAPSYDVVAFEGAKIDNVIYIHIKFGEMLNFMDVVDRLRKVRRFFGVLVGRHQNLLEFNISTGEDEYRPPMRVFGSLLAKYQRSDNKLHPKNPLIDVARDPNGFSNVLAAWLERENDWCDARERFFQSFEKGANYDIDRLISAANVFDIMPEKAFTKPERLQRDLAEAKEKAKKIFKKLPQSADRDDALDALGRIGRLKLKRKIDSRSSCLLNRIGDLLPELSLVTDEAVNCRNHYVHGGESRIDYNKERNIRIFLTDTLEFVFAAADLVEAGWDIEAWCKGWHGHHPFTIYLTDYSDKLKRLKSLLPT